jgi:carboxymethylenebutenolidase
MTIEEKSITLDRNGRKMPVYISAPAGGDGPYPGVIVVHEIFGLDEHIKDVARRFTAQGFVAFAPDLFDGHENVPADKTNLADMRKCWSGIPDATFVEDLQALYAMAQADPRVKRDNIGVIGYCRGGAIAYMFGASTPGVAWIGDYYGRVKYQDLTATKAKHPIDYTETLTSPVIGLFSGQDELIPKEHVQELEGRIKAKGLRNEFVIYDDAKHAFFNDARPFYDEKAAKDAWKRTIEFVTKS